MTVTTEKLAVSLRKDLPKSVTWSGIPLQSGVDMMFWVEGRPEQGTTRIVRAVLIKSGLSLQLQPLRDFDLETLGSDFVHLETRGQETVVVGNYFRKIAAFAEPNRIRFLVDVAGTELIFVGITGIMGRWDWLVHPEDVQEQVHVKPVPIGQMLVRAVA